MCSSTRWPIAELPVAPTMATRIWLEQLQELIAAGAQVVEVLPEDDYAPAHLPGAINLPLRELDEPRAGGARSHPAGGRLLLGLALRPQSTSRVPARELGIRRRVRLRAREGRLARPQPAGRGRSARGADRRTRDARRRRAVPPDRSRVRRARVDRAFAISVRAGHEPPAGRCSGEPRASALDARSEQPVWEVAEPGPKTFRPHTSAEKVAAALAEKDLRWAIVTTPEGRLLGVAWREDLEQPS